MTSAKSHSKNNSNAPSVNHPRSSPEEVTYYEENPSMFRNCPVEFILTGVSCLVGIGFFIYFFWWLRCKGTLLTITSERSRLRRGILSKSVTEVWHRDVRNVQLNQTFFQRILGVGSLGISSAGQAEIEIQVSGIPDPERAKELIDRHRMR